MILLLRPAEYRWERKTSCMMWQRIWAAGNCSGGSALRPGSPAMAFMYDSTCVLCLSGNPFGAGAGMELLVRPALSYLTGRCRVSWRRKQSAVMSEDFPKPSKMRRFLRAVLTGEEVRLSKGLASSGVLSTLKDCNCIIDIPAGSPGLKRGEEVCVRIL